MKKIFTFLFFTTIISSAFAQTRYANTENNKSSYNHFHNDPRYERNKEIEKINYINSIQVTHIVNDPYLTIWEKRDALDALESKRIEKVNAVYQDYSSAVAYSTLNEIDNSFDRVHHYNDKDYAK